MRLLTSPFIVLAALLVGSRAGAVVQGSAESVLCKNSAEPKSLKNHGKSPPG
jgi:hypothetical protein